MRRVSIVVTVAALAGLAGCGTTTRTESVRTAAPTASPTTSPASPAADWVFFEPRDSMRYYEADGSLGFFRMRLSDGKEERLSVAAGNYFWHPSPDGRMIAAVKETKGGSDLLVGSAEGLPSLRKIDSLQHEVSSVLWARGNEVLFYVTFEPKDNNEPPRTGPERLYEIRPDGSGKRLVTTWQHLGAYAYRDLRAFDAPSSTIFWSQDTREGAGGQRDLYATSVKNGATRKVLDFNTIGNLNLSIREDGSTAYYVESGAESKLIEAHTADGTKRVVYETDGKTETAIESVYVTPNGARLLFQGTADPDFGPSIEAKETRTTTYIVDLADNSRAAVFNESHKMYQKHRARPSVDAGFVWLNASVDDAATFLLEVATGRKTVVVEQSAGERPVSARFISWLTVSS